MGHQGLMITGTDTGVGKTFVGCGLAAAMRRRGLTVAPFKPAETGCEIDPSSGELLPRDAMLLQEATQTSASIDAICPYRYQMPVAPWVASQREEQEMDSALLARRYQELAGGHDVVIVETAGGILVPLTASFHFGDLARLLGLPVLLIAGSKLGVINQALLTMEYLKAARLQQVGVVLNHPTEEATPAVQTNEAALRKLISGRLFVLPKMIQTTAHLAKLYFDELADFVLQRLKD
jgi:dethiobiotin synthetase